MSWEIDVACTGNPRVGWTCFVTIRADEASSSEHEVRVAPPDLVRLAPAARDPSDLVQRSLAFLLEREPPSSILRSFEIADIGRYYPEFEATIRRS
jgi:hypothetical protein